tara:strand:- start:672 stop:1601 length:930 start_codon:yes stop_codon:yes gene_type:complete
VLTKYKFKIESGVRVDRVFPLSVDQYVINFEIKNEEIVAIEILEPTDLTQISKVTSEAGKIKNIDVRGVDPNKFRSHLKLAEGLLSVFGIRSIDVDGCVVTWIPANEEESKLLELYEFGFGLIGPDENKEKIPFSLVAQAVIAGFDNKCYEVSLSFYRKGKNDMAVREYVDAFYDFYFVLETLFGDGKTKNAQIEKNLLSSKKVSLAIGEAKKQSHLIELVSKEIVSPFDYMNSSPEEIIKHIVLRRGFLHHHNPRHPRAWSPDLQKEFHLDAAFIMSVAHHIIWGKVKSYIYAEKVISTLQTSYRLGR